MQTPRIIVNITIWRVSVRESVQKRVLLALLFEHYVTNFFLSTSLVAREIHLKGE